MNKLPKMRVFYNPSHKLMNLNIPNHSNLDLVENQGIIRRNMYDT